MITDGEPTAHIEGREVVLIYPPAEKTATHTLAEVRHCANAGIRVSSFALIEDYFYLGLVNFVEEMARVSKGVAAYCSADEIGKFVFESFVGGRHTQAIRAAEARRSSILSPRGCRATPSTSPRAVRQTGQPGLVHEADVDHVADMTSGPCLGTTSASSSAAIRGRRPGTSLSPPDSSIPRRRERIVGSDLLPGEEDMDGVAGLGSGPVEEHVDPLDVPEHEAGLRQRLLRGLEIRSVQQDIDVLSIPHRRFIHPRNPGRDGVASDDRIGNPGAFQGGGGTLQSLSHSFHGPHHPIE